MIKKFSSPKNNIFNHFFIFSYIFRLHSHSGRTDNEGCHNDKKENTKHCHQSKIADVTPQKLGLLMETL